MSDFIDSGKVDGPFSLKDVILKQRTSKETEKCAEVVNPFRKYIILGFQLSTVLNSVSNSQGE